MNTAIATLPTSGDSATWTPQESALVEAAGLTKKQGRDTVLAPRPVVEAFLQHCMRTGLDPIARQIYCIERGGKWGTQVSIDGARLVAQRSGEYRGQTPVEWTADGQTWVQVWLSKENPAAARAGVYREGFAEPLYAVATWTQYNAGGNMWSKMPALMLGKCAEMLALRKAFPMELSGLYSAEEMAQADRPASSAPKAEQPALPAAPEAPTLVSDEWLDRAATVSFKGADVVGAGGLRALFREARDAGVLGLRVDADEELTYADLLMKRAPGLPDEAPVDVEPVQDSAADAAATVGADVATGEVADGEPVTEWKSAPIPDGDAA